MKFFFLKITKEPLFAFIQIFIYTNTMVKEFKDHYNKPVNLPRKPVKPNAIQKYNGGLKKKFEDPEAMRDAIEEYLNDCWTQEVMVNKSGDVQLDKDGNAIMQPYKQTRPYTMTGLALALGMSRVTLMNYERRVGYEDYHDIVAEARTICENYAEERSLTSPHAVGSIFNLKANYQWQDKVEIEHSGKIDVAFTDFLLAGKNSNAIDADYEDA